jgi:hypothetical protein
MCVDVVVEYFWNNISETSNIPADLESWGEIYFDFFPFAHIFNYVFRYYLFK